MNINYAIMLIVLCIHSVHTEYANGKYRNNLLIVFIDDMRYLTNKDMFLPNIQNLAAEGVTFENAYAQVNIFKKYIGFLILFLCEYSCVFVSASTVRS